jgi:hypothetical protein
MKKFFLALLDSTNPLNSKIFAGLIMIFAILVMIVASFFKPIQIEIFYGTISLCAALFGLSVVPFKGGSNPG